MQTQPAQTQPMQTQPMQTQPMQTQPQTQPMQPMQPQTQTQPVQAPPPFGSLSPANASSSSAPIVRLVSDVSDDDGVEIDLLKKGCMYTTLTRVLYTETDSIGNSILDMSRDMTAFKDLHVTTSQTLQSINETLVGILDAIKSIAGRPTDSS
jgi:hypothetical protein